MNSSKVFNKTAFGLALLLTLGSAKALADQRIYRMNTANVASFSALSSNAKRPRLRVIDSIPQLGVVLMEAADGRRTGADDMGSNRQIVLRLPQQARLTLPSGFWGLKAIEVAKAWQKGSGAGIVVAISDTGIDQANADLRANIWVNPGEDGVDAQGRNRQNNGVDDDQNGYVDDVNGWDFVNNRPASRDNHYHGTHVAGTIAAVNSARISGVAPNAKLMNVPFLGGAGGGSEFNGAKTIVYAADQGAKIINCSWGGPGESPIIAEAIAYAANKGVLVVAAAGNDGVNIDREIFTPAAIPSENIVSVGATSSASGGRASFSNYGAVNVDLAAPGKDIKSTAVGGGTRVLSGTSMAAPHVSGVAALVWSINPSLTAEEVKDILMESAVTKSPWRNRSQTGAVLNADRAAQMAVSGRLLLSSLSY